jgi:hypothetical protein
MDTQNSKLYLRSHTAGLELGIQLKGYSQRPPNVNPEPEGA